MDPSTDLPPPSTTSTRGLISEVQIDGAALLRIVKHCEDNLPGASTGALLGLDVPKENGKVVMQVTYAFALPRGRDAGYQDDRPGHNRQEEEENEEERSELAKHEYKKHMMKMLKEVNVDSNMVGWYRTMQLGHFSEGGSKIDASGLRAQRTLFDVPPALVDEMAETNVVLLYDPVQTAMGDLTVKAYRHLRTPTTREEVEGVVSFKDLLEEIPVVIRNAGIVSAFLWDMQQEKMVPVATAPAAAATRQGEVEGVDADFTKLDLSFNPFLSRNLELLSEEVDRMAAQLEKFKRFATGQGGRGGYHQREHRSWGKRREEEEERNAEPNRVETVMTATQIDAYCSQISSFSKSGVSKLYLVGSLHKEAGGEGGGGGEGREGREGQKGGK